MSVELVHAEPGTFTLRVSGILTQKELAAAQAAASARMRAGRKIRILVLLEDFSGWERGGTWDDFSFQADHDQDIAKMAFVGDPEWEDQALMFVARDLRCFPIQYFASERLELARNWLLTD